MLAVPLCLPILRPLEYPLTVIDRHDILNSVMQFESGNHDFRLRYSQPLYLSLETDNHNHVFCIADSNIIY